MFLLVLLTTMVEETLADNDLLPTLLLPQDNTLHHHIFNWSLLCYNGKKRMPLQDTAAYYSSTAINIRGGENYHFFLFPLFYITLFSVSLSLRNGNGLTTCARFLFTKYKVISLRIKQKRFLPLLDYDDALSSGAYEP